MGPVPETGGRRNEGRAGFIPSPTHRAWLACQYDQQSPPGCGPQRLQRWNVRFQRRVVRSVLHSERKQNGGPVFSAAIRSQLKTIGFIRTIKWRFYSNVKLIGFQAKKGLGGSPRPFSLNQVRCRRSVFRDYLIQPTSCQQLKSSM